MRSTMESDPILQAIVIVTVVVLGLGPLAFGILRGWEDVSLASLVRSGVRLRFDLDRLMIVPAEPGPPPVRPSPPRTPRRPSAPHPLRSAAPCRYCGTSGEGRCASCGAPR